MKILILALLSFNTFASDIDSTRLRMELDYLKADKTESSELVTESTIENEEEINSPVMAEEENLKFRRKAKENPEILPLEDIFDEVKLRAAAPKREKAAPEKKPVTRDGSIPKDVFEELED